MSETPDNPPAEGGRPYPDAELQAALNDLARRYGVGGVFITADGLDPRLLPRGEAHDAIDKLRQDLNESVILVDNPVALREALGLDSDVLRGLLRWHKDSSA
jgi:hypothetical protein